MTIKMVATDLDGTLFDSKKRFDKERLQNIIYEFEKRDVKFAVATGNQLYTIIHYFDDMDMRKTYVSDNGALVKDGEDILYEKYLDKDIVKDVLDLLKDRDDVCVIICGEDGAYISNDEPAYLTKLVPIYFKLFESVDNIYEYTDRVFKLSLLCDEPLTSEIERHMDENFGDRVTVVTSGNLFVDIIDKEVNKGKGLKILLDEFGIKEDELMVFGDNDNDIEMLKMAGASFAMDMASKGAIRAAKYRAPSNEENGVLDVLENWLDRGKIG